MMSVLGLDPLSWEDRDGDAHGVHDVIDALVQAALADRAQAREDRDYAAADAIRDRLAAAGIALEDTPDGVRWSLTREH